MSVPGNELIAKVMMVAEGFEGCTDHGTTHLALCLLSRQLLSMQQHYECPFAATHLVSRRTVAAGPRRNHKGQNPSFGAHGPRRQKVI